MLIFSQIRVNLADVPGVMPLPPLPGLVPGAAPSLGMPLLQSSAGGVDLDSVDPVVNNQTRTLLMAKLNASGGGVLPQSAVPLQVPPSTPALGPTPAAVGLMPAGGTGVLGTAPRSWPGVVPATLMVPGATPPTLGAPMVGPVEMPPTRCLLLKNMFDPTSVGSLPTD